MLTSILDYKQILTMIVKSSIELLSQTTVIISIQAMHCVGKSRRAKYFLSFLAH